MVETLKLGIDGLDDIEQIGAGGSSRVYRAKQVELDRLVALKVIKASDDPEVARRFDRERKAMGRLSLNEGIVPVYSSGITDRGEPYLIMPYYSNGSLQDRIEAGPVPWAEAVDYMSSAAKTMRAAHEAGVVHLDLKPANVLLSSNGAPRIADFGIAKMMSDQSASGNTGPAFTPTFTAPETLLGGEASPASDVYGLAATLWALIAGRPPFRATGDEDNTLMAVVGRVVHQPAADLRHLAPDAICAVIETAMAKEPADRYPTAGAFSQALDQAAVVAAGVTDPADPTVTIAPGGAAGAAATGAAAVGAAGRAPQGAPSPQTAESDDALAQTSLQFDAAVPPRLVPAGTARAAGLTDAVDRYSGVAVGLGVAAVLLLAVFLGQRLLTGDDTATADSAAQVVEANGSTSSSAPSAQAGAGSANSADADDELASPTATSTTEASTTTAVSSAPISVTTTPTSATSESPTTTSIEETTTSDQDATTTIEETTTIVEETTTTVDETTTTVEETTTTTVPRLSPPLSVSAVLFRGGRVTVSWVAPIEADGLAGYTVLRDGVVVGTTGPGAAQYVDRELPLAVPGTRLLYQVRADGPATGNPRSSALSAGAEVILDSLEVEEDADLLVNG